MTEDQALELLRAAGWTCIPPARDRPPEPAVGQVWVSSKPRTEARTVVELRLNSWGEDVVAFTTPSGGGAVILAHTWRTWVRKSGARPTPAVQTHIGLG